MIPGPFVATPIPDSKPQRARLLLVDEQAPTARIVMQTFSADHDVLIATSITRALEFCEKSTPDLILLDLTSPELNGLALSRQLKERQTTFNIPIIFLTDTTEETGESACWAAGGVDFVSKPLNPTTLRNRVRVQLMLKLQADQLQERSTMDDLTGIANRRYFEQRLDAEWRRCARSNSPLAVLLLDVDFFKRYNDTYGHEAGDECLRRIGGMLKQELRRPFDLAARYGGEEFACILPETNFAGANITAAMIERAVRSLRIDHPQSEIDEVITVSAGLGWAVPTRDHEPNELVRMADKQLYLAKHERGRVHSGMLNS